VIYFQRIFSGLLCVLALVDVSTAQLFYSASEPTQQIDLVNFTTGAVTNLHKVGSRPDSILVRNGKILYTVSPRGTLEQFDPTTKTNKILATFPNGGPRDMVYEPGRNSILIALYTTARLARYNFNTGSVTVFPTTKIGSSVDGLAYDPAGNLYAVVSHNTICQLNPNTGAILQTLVLEPHNKVNGGDGLLYDNFTHNLWTAHDGTKGNGLIQIPLTATKPPRLGSPIFRQTGKIHVPDGIISDGVGNLYIGEGLQYLTQYSIAKDAIIKRVLVKGIDSPAFKSEPATSKVQ
jgi:streptogramin lyase